MHFMKNLALLSLFWAFSTLAASADPSADLLPAWLGLIETGKPVGLLNQCTSPASVRAYLEWNPDRDLRTLEPMMAVQSVLEFNGLSPDLSQGMPEGNRAGVVAYFRALVQSDDSFVETALRYLKELRTRESPIPAQFQSRLDLALTFVEKSASPSEQNYRALQLMALYGHRSNPLLLLPIEGEIEPQQCRPIYMDTAIPSFSANRMAAREPSVLATFLGCRAARGTNAESANLPALVDEYLKILGLSNTEHGHDQPFEETGPHVAGFKKGFDLCRVAGQAP